MDKKVYIVLKDIYDFSKLDFDFNLDFDKPLVKDQVDKYIFAKAGDKIEYIGDTFYNDEGRSADLTSDIIEKYLYELRR